jgi:hypothetical protein
MRRPACVFYGAAKLDRDTCVAIHEDAVNLVRLGQALDDLRGEVPSPPSRWKIGAATPFNSSTATCSRPNQTRPSELHKGIPKRFSLSTDPGRVKDGTDDW